MKKVPFYLNRPCKNILSLFFVFVIATVSISAQTHSLKLIIDLMDESIMLDIKAEVWIKGMGSWHLNNMYDRTDSINKYRLSGRDTPKLYSENSYTLFFYPDGRDGKEYTVKFKIDKNNCKSACPRDALNVEVYEDRIRFYGLPIKAVDGTFSKEIDR